MDTAEIEWRNPLLPNDIQLKSATHFGANHKTKVMTQTLFCFVPQSPNQNEAKWTVSLFENVQGKSSPKWICPKILKKVDTLFLVWETLVKAFHWTVKIIPKIKYVFERTKMVRMRSKFNEFHGFPKDVPISSPRAQVFSFLSFPLLSFSCSLRLPPFDLSTTPGCCC